MQIPIRVTTRIVRSVSDRGREAAIAPSGIESKRANSAPPITREPVTIAACTTAGPTACPVRSPVSGVSVEPW